MSALNQLIQSLPLHCCFLEVAQCYCTYLSVSNTHVNKHLQFSSVYFSCSFSAPYLSTGLMWKELLTIYYSDIQKNIILQFHFIANMSQAIMLLHSSSSLAGCINSCVDIFTWIVKVSHRITFIVQRLSISAPVSSSRGEPTRQSQCLGKMKNCLECSPNAFLPFTNSLTVYRIYEVAETF